MDDLVERLRANGLDECDEAIARIAHLEAQIAAADKLAVEATRVRAALAAYLASKEPSE
jgi:hypothetical protein